MSTTAEKGAPPSVKEDALAGSEKPKSKSPIKEKSVSGGCLSVVVLGASGDLAKKKTFPAIFNLYKQVQWASIFLQTSLIWITYVRLYLF